MFSVGIIYRTKKIQRCRFSISVHRPLEAISKSHNYVSLQDLSQIGISLVNHQHYLCYKVPYDNKYSTLSFRYGGSRLNTYSFSRCLQRFLYLSYQNFTHRTILYFCISVQYITTSCYSTWSFYQNVLHIQYAQISCLLYIFLVNHILSTYIAR